jgi:hypothetical protein
VSERFMSRAKRRSRMNDVKMLVARNDHAAASYAKARTSLTHAPMEAWASGVPAIETQRHGGPLVRQACRGQHQPRGPWPTGCSRLGTPATMPDPSPATISVVFGDGRRVAVYLQCETGSEAF